MARIDLRSDTVTLPTPAMREAMYRAELGDDVYREDPTVNRLQEMAAERMGTDAGLFVASGTMGNLVAVLTHVQRGDEVILGDQSHILVYEAGGVSVLGGAMAHAVPNLPDGSLDPVAVEGAVRGANIHFPRTRLICLENTHNRCGGTVVSLAQMAAVRAVAVRHRLAVHLDGARIFNAAVALGVPVREIAAQVDTVQFCFSKGLAAPVGSMICGSADFIKEAIRIRKLVGGGMRQAGVLAAAGIVALEQMVDRLAEDHENARFLADCLAGVDGFDVDREHVQTNIVMLKLTRAGVSAEKVVAALAAQGVLVSVMDPTRLRAVTHYGITRQDVEQAVQTAREVMQAL
ncbi:MAG: low-specificity L-threonine aldolase [Anaerolineae bacterium]